VPRDSFRSSFGSCLEDEVNNFGSFAKRFIEDGISSLLFQLNSSMDEKHSQIKDSFDEVYFGFKKNLNDLLFFDFNTSKNNYSGINSETKSYQHENFPNIYQNFAQDAQIINEDKSNIANNSSSMCKSEKTMKNNYSAKKYTDLMADFISQTNGKINNIAEVIAGKYNYSSEIKTRKLKRMWKWEDRLKYIESLSAEGTLSVNNNAQYIQQLQSVVKSNKYLRYKKKGYYLKLQELLVKF
jgi:hypothetical protein